MPLVNSSTPCIICENSFAVMNSHHTVPRACGGEDSLQIILCPTCHDTLHANGVYLVSKLRNPKRAPKTFWPNARQEERASKWLQILVQAIVTHSTQKHDDLCHLVSTKLNSADMNLFKTLAKDLGCSQEAALTYCIKFTLQTKGLKSEQHQKTPTMWFLPSSKK